VTWEASPWNPRFTREVFLLVLGLRFPVIGSRFSRELDGYFDYAMLTNITFTAPNTNAHGHQLFGIMSNRGELEAAGDKRMRSIEFHKQLEDEKVIPSKTLLETLYHFARSDFDIHDMQPKIKASTMVDENPNRGAVRYSTARAELLLSYSPWEYAEYDNLLNGNITIKVDIPERYNPKVQSDLEEKISQVKYIEPVLEDKEVAAIQIPADPQIPENYTEELSDLANSL
jgi:hypothetical protein